MAARSILRNTFTVGAFTAASRVLGLVREMLQSRIVGAGVEQSAFSLAFAIPNMARKLFGEGALTAAFVPVFRGEVERGELESARRLARAVMTMVVMILGATVTLAVMGMSAYLGFAEGLSERAELTIRLVRILFPYMIFICAAAFGMGVMNALGKFAEGAMMPAMLNVIWIAALVAIGCFPNLAVSTRVALVAWAILAGGAAQMAFLFRCMAKKGFPPWPLFGGFRAADVRLVWRNTAIAALGAGAIQINYMLDAVLAQYANEWAASVIGYAERLMDLPLGVIGVAFGTVLLPTFAAHFVADDLAGAREALVSSVTRLMFVMIPAAAGLVALAPEVTAVIYEGGKFDATSTVRVARALGVYALGLGFFGLQKSLIPWFQAQNDMKTPLRISVATVILNATLNVLAVTCLPVEWRHVGLAASTVACAAVGCMLLVVAARIKNGSIGLGAAVPPIARSLAAAVAMALLLWWLKPRFASFRPVLALALLVALGAGVYGAFAAVLMRRELRAALRRGRRG